MLDLVALAAGRYRVERFDRSNAVHIPGRYGRIATSEAGVHLTATVTSPAKACACLNVPGVRFLACAGSVITIGFDPEQLDAVAALLWARRKRGRPRLFPVGARLTPLSGLTPGAVKIGETK